MFTGIINRIMMVKRRIRELEEEINKMQNVHDIFGSYPSQQESVSNANTETASTDKNENTAKDENMKLQESILKSAQFCARKTQTTFSASKMPYANKSVKQNNLLETSGQKLTLCFID